jgi:hypothetical protein
VGTTRLIGVRGRDGRVVLRPDPDTFLQPGDVVIVQGGWLAAAGRAGARAERYALGASRAARVAPSASLPALARAALDRARSPGPLPSPTFSPLPPSPFPHPHFPPGSVRDNNLYATQNGLQVLLYEGAAGPRAGGAVEDGASVASDDESNLVQVGGGQGGPAASGADCSPIARAAPAVADRPLPAAPVGA